MTRKALNIMVVEDNLADAKLTCKLVAQCELVDPERVHIAEDGEQALSYLRGEEPWTSRPMPHLLFLDLNIPKVGGLEVLQQIREDATLSGLPVIVLSSSAARRDVDRAYDLKVNAYLRKPGDLIGFQALMKSIDAFWFRSCRLPGSPYDRQERR